jgi:hypothetical protein
MAKDSVVITEGNLSTIEQALGLIRSEGVAGVKAALECIRDDGVKRQFISHIIEKSENKGNVLVYALAYALQNAEDDLVNAIVTNESFKSISGACVKSALERIYTDNDELKIQFIGHIIEKSSNKEDVLVYALAYAILNDKGGLVNFIVNNESFKSISGVCVKSALELIYIADEELKIRFIDHIIEKSANKEYVLVCALAYSLHYHKGCLVDFIVNKDSFKSISGVCIKSALELIDSDKGKIQFFDHIIEKSANKEDVLLGALGHVIEKKGWGVARSTILHAKFKSLDKEECGELITKAFKGNKIDFFKLIIEKYIETGDLGQILYKAIEEKNWEVAKVVITQDSSISLVDYKRKILIEMALDNDNNSNNKEFIKTIIEKSANKEYVLREALDYAIKKKNWEVAKVVITQDSSISLVDYKRKILIEMALDNDNNSSNKEFIKTIIEKSANKEDVLREALDYAIKKKNWEVANVVIDEASSISLTNQGYRTLIEMALGNDNNSNNTNKKSIETIIEKSKSKALVAQEALAYAIEENNWEFAKVVIDKASSISLTDEQYIALIEMAFDNDNDNDNNNNNNNNKESIKTIIEKSRNKEDVLRKALAYAIEEKNWEVAKIAIVAANFRYRTPDGTFEFLRENECGELITKAFEGSEIDFLKLIIEKSKNKEHVVQEVLTDAIGKEDWEVAKVVIDEAISIPLFDYQYKELIRMALDNDNNGNNKEFIKTIIEKSKRNKALVAQEVLDYAIKKKNWEVAKDICESTYIDLGSLGKQVESLLEMAVGADDTEIIKLIIGSHTTAASYKIKKALAYAINNKKEDIVLSILADENFNKLGDKRFSVVMQAMKMITALEEDKSDLIKRCIYPVLKEFFIRSYDDKSEEAIIGNLLMSIPSESEGAAGEIVSSLLVSVMENEEITAERCGIVLKQLLKRGFIQTAKDIIFIQPYDDKSEEKIIEKLLEPFIYTNCLNKREIVVSLFVSVMENEKMTAERCGIVFKTLFKKGLSQAARAIIEKIKDKDDFITSILSKVCDYDKNIALYTLLAGGVEKDKLLAGGVEKDKLIELAKKVDVDSSIIKDDPALQDTPTADATDSPAVSAAATPAEDSESPASVVGDDTTPAEDSESPASVVGDDTTPALSAAATLTTPQGTTADGAAAPGNDTSVSRSALLRGVPAAGLGAGLTAMGVYTAVLPPVFCVLSPLATVAMGACIFFMVGSLVSALYLGANATELAEQRYNREEEGGMSLSS